MRDHENEDNPSTTLVFFFSLYFMFFFSFLGCLILFFLGYDVALIRIDCWNLGLIYIYKFILLDSLSYFYYR